MPRSGPPPGSLSFEMQKSSPFPARLPVDPSCHEQVPGFEEIAITMPRACAPLSNASQAAKRTRRQLARPSAPPSFTKRSQNLPLTLRSITM